MGGSTEDRDFPHIPRLEASARVLPAVVPGRHNETALSHHLRRRMSHKAKSEAIAASASKIAATAPWNSQYDLDAARRTWRAKEFFGHRSGPEATRHCVPEWRRSVAHRHWRDAQQVAVCGAISHMLSTPSRASATTRKRNALVSDSRAMRGAPRKTPVRTGRTATPVYWANTQESALIWLSNSGRHGDSNCCPVLPPDRPGKIQATGKAHVAVRIRNCQGCHGGLPQAARLRIRTTVTPIRIAESATSHPNSMYSNKRNRLPGW